jgi:prepilin peptidase CpaA
VLIALECVAVLISLTAAVSDMRTRRIPNALSAALVVVGIVIQAFASGVNGAAIACVMIVLAILVGSFAHAQRWLGGGDVKLLAGGLACFGPQYAPDFLLVTALAGGVLALTMAAREHRVAAVFGNAAFGMLYGRGRIPSSASTARIPYAVAICSGMLLTFALRFLPSMRLPL